MKFYIATIPLFLSCGGLASQGSWPREAFILYAAHRLDFHIVQDTTKVKIGTGCTAEAGETNKPCNMDQFLRHICKKPPAKATGLRDWPDIDHAIKKIKEAGFDTLKYDMSKVLPSNPGAAHGKLMAEAAKSIKKSAAVIYADGFNVKFLDELLTDADKARKYAHTVRSSEQSPAKVGGGEPDRKYEDIDVDGTKAKAKTDADKAAIEATNNDWNEAKLGTATEKDHEVILRSYRGTVKTAIEGAVACMPEKPTQY